MRRSRMGLLSLGVTVVLLASSACSLGETASSDQGNDKVEVFSWWTGEGEEEGLEALIDDFTTKNPGIEFINATVSGGAGSNAKQVLSTRLDSNDPPDSYQAHAGLELTGDIQQDRLEDLNALYDREGWRNKIPKGLLEAITVDGRIYSVPVNIHRANLLWYNPKVLANVGIGEPPTTWNEFLTQTSVLKAEGITPIAVGPLWTQKQLLETILLGELGAERYTGLWNGQTDWRSPQVIKALTTAARVFGSSDVKNSSGDWQSSMDRTIAGEAAYTIMGDWAYGYNLRKSLKYQTDFAVVHSPGAKGIYDFLSDSFTLPKGAPHPKAAEKWLIECGSVDGQDVFNPQKGSIPARTDVDQTKYTGYLAEAMAEWQDPATEIVGSLTHGVTVSVELNDALDAILKKFVEDSDPDGFATSFMTAYAATR
ncbi:MAG: carbohydrate ABC transporter substrate-binding protein [Dactylosporangium sp.]|nr:ABC transporter substrate-binding protein [Dactylosporangium sp.]NNJ62149.1 carbohydrate ABC transporter substrate-binding protein [Dactylosporangium sp.]